MDKEVASYKVDIIVVLIAFVLIVLTNIQMFFSDNVFALMYGLGLIILFCVTLYSLILIDRNLEKSLNLNLKNGLIMVFYYLIESFLPGSTILGNFRIIGWVFLINGVLIFRRSYKLLKILNEEENISNMHVNYNDTFSNNNYDNIYEDVYDESSASVLNDGIVVNGYIKDVVYDDVNQVYYLEIEYFYDGDIYVFYYRGFNIDITPILDQKQLRKINVYLPGNSPEFAQIDEELLLYRINN